MAHISKTKTNFSKIPSKLFLRASESCDRGQLVSAFQLTFKCLQEKFIAERWEMAYSIPFEKLFYIRQ